jgi:hypothetical protein
MKIRKEFIILLFLLISACSSKTETESVSSSQWKMFYYLPYNTEYLLYTNFQELRKTKFGSKEFITSISNDTSDNWINKFEKETGVGLKKGISEIIIANTSDDASIILIKFSDNNQVKNYFDESSEFIKDKINGKEIYFLKEKPSTIIYFPEKFTLIVSNKKSQVKSIILNEGKRLKENTSFLSVVKNIKNKNSIWMATDKGAFAAGLFDRIAGKDSRLLSPEVLSSISNLTVSASFNDGVQLESALGCNTAGNAYLLTSAVEGAIALNILSKKNYKLGKIFNKMDVDREGNLIRFHISLSENELNDLQKLTDGTNPVNKF